MAPPLGKRVLDYFDLRSPLPSSRGGSGALGAAQGTPPVATGAATPAAVGLPWLGEAWQRELWPLAVYAAGMVGIIAKQWYDGYQRGVLFDVHPSTFVLAVVISAVTFPATYHSLQVESKPGLQLFLALQNGFFWQTVLGQVMR